MVADGKKPLFDWHTWKSSSRKDIARAIPQLETEWRNSASLWIRFFTLVWNTYLRSTVTSSAFSPGAWAGNLLQFSQFSCSVVSTMCDPMNRSTPGLTVHHQLPELTQTHVHLFGDAIQPSPPLSSPSSPPLNISQHQGLFKWVNSWHQGAKYWSFSFNISPSNEYPGWYPLGWTGSISLQYKGLSRVFSNTAVQKQQFFGAQLSF